MGKHGRFLLAALMLCVLSFNGIGSEELEGTPPVENAVSGPVIKVYGNGHLIENGAAYPRDYNLTDFGFEYVDERHTHWFVIENSGDADLVLSGPFYVSIVGIDREHFYVRTQPAAATIPAGGSTDFAIAFEPESYGDKEVTVQIYSNDTSNSPYTFLIRGGDDDDDRIHWYGSCAMSKSGDMEWLLPLALLGVGLILRRTIFSAAC